MLYFAYGSNMDFRQMRDRCPSVRFLAVAKLPGHRLDFTRRSNPRQCGVADVVVDDVGEVWGVVYDIAETDLGRLDWSEGYRPGREAHLNSYFRDQRHVLRDGDEKSPLLVWIYLANREPDPPRPNSAYKGLIVDGAVFWHLPSDYIEKLRQIAIA